MVRGLMCGHSPAFWVERQLGACAKGGADRPAADARRAGVYARDLGTFSAPLVGTDAVAVCPLPRG
eukprot:scaffold8559_cov78-Phaeocystis_antarctica.AAC.3